MFQLVTHLQTIRESVRMSGMVKAQFIIPKESRDIVTPFTITTHTKYLHKYPHNIYRTPIWATKMNISREC